MNIVPSFEQGKLQQNGIEAVSETNLFFWLLLTIIKDGLQLRYHR